MRTWRDGDLNELTIEGRTIQQRIPKPSTSVNNDHLTRTFAKLMFQEKTKAHPNDALSITLVIGPQQRPDIRLRSTLQ